MLSSCEFRFVRCLSATLILVGLGLSVGSLAQRAQTTSISVPQSLFLDCTPLSINITITKSQVESPQSVLIANWACNVDALTQYRLNSTLVTTTTNIPNADAGDFTANCTSATNGGICAMGVGLTGSDPINRRGIGGNTAGTHGADFAGNIFVSVSSWDVGSLSGNYNGVIAFFVTDLTP